MKHWQTRISYAVRRVIQCVHRENRDAKLPVEAYCADCGGMTLIRDLAKQRIYCPQCTKE